MTVDLRDPVNPFNNRGVTIQGYTATGGDVTSSKAGMSPSVRGIYQLFEESYSNFGEEFFRSFAKGSDDTGSDMVLIELKPVKIVHWEGPTFKAVKLWPLID